jgi:hypothetical protein
MYRTRPLSGPTIQTGPGDYDPPDEGCPGCDDLHAEAQRLREQLAEQDEVLSEVTAERDRLARVLAVERGDVTAAPDGWRWRGSWRVERGEDLWASVALVTQGAERWWGWYVGGAPSRLDGRADTALEAMEAADAALARVTPC